MPWTNKHVSGNVVEGDVFILTAATQAMRRFVNSDNVTYEYETQGAVSKQES